MQLVYASHDNKWTQTIIKIFQEQRINSKAQNDIFYCSISAIKEDSLQRKLFHQNAPSDITILKYVKTFTLLSVPSKNSNGKLPTCLIVISIARTNEKMFWSEVMQRI